MLLENQTIAKQCVLMTICLGRSYICVMGKTGKLVVT